MRTYCGPVLGLMIGIACVFAFFGTLLISDSRIKVAQLKSVPDYQPHIIMSDEIRFREPHYFLVDSF
jgi:hypothetical protein